MVPVGVLDNLHKPQNKAQLVDLLTYHMGLGNLTFRNIYGKELIPSVEGSNLTATWHIGGCPHGPRHYCNWIDKQRLNGFVSASSGNVYPIGGVLTPPGAKTNIVQLAESVSDLSTLVAAVVAGDLADTLSSPGPFTVFAPTNEAFKALPPGTFDRLMKPENKKELVDILTYHVLPEKVLSKDLVPFQVVKTVEGKPLHVTKSGGLVRVGASLESKDLKNVTKADNVANNGVVHIIDGVLLQPSGPSGDNIAELAAANPDLSTLITALKAADLVGTLSGEGPFTVFAPTNEAFAKLPVGVLDNLLKPQNKAELVDLLTYHVGLGNLTFRNIYGKEGVPSVEGSNLTATWHIGGCPGGPRHYCNFIDKQRLNGFVSASNGNVYPVDGVLTPPGAKTNIVQLAESVSDLSTLVAAVVAGDLADTLSSPGPFTVFAPTNEAFKALPP